VDKNTKLALDHAWQWFPGDCHPAPVHSGTARSDELDAATREEREAFTRTVELVRQRWSTARIYRVLGVFNDYRVQYQVRA
jgi:hypothetical protein